MIMSFKRWCLTLIDSFIFLLLPFFCCARTVTPYMYGLAKAYSDIDRYYVLQKMHEDAVAHGYIIDYGGIDTISLEIPYNAKTLVLPHVIDFQGVNFKIRNKVKDFTLFELSDTLSPCNVKWDLIKKNILKDIPQNCLIVVEDENPWVNERKGYGIAHIRSDVLLVRRGKILNKVVASYDTKDSKPKLFMCPVSKGTKKVENLSVSRDCEDLYKTFILRITNQNDVLLKNILISTPETNLYGDEAIKIANCTNVLMKNICINGTYSQYKKWGYGINMINVWNVIIENLKAEGKWGVFGNVNVNTAFLKHCDINRFDIHCYGANIFFDDCIFRNLYNQFSSVYGKVVFNSCTFLRFTPLLIEPSYNAYTPFDVEWNNCFFLLDSEHGSILSLMELTEDANSRPELQKKCIPNVYIKNCKVDFADKLRKWHLIYTGKVTYKENLGYISEICIDGLEVKDTNTSFDIFSSKIETEDSLRINVNKMITNRSGVKTNYILKDLNIGDNANVYQDGNNLKNTETSCYGNWIIGGSLCFLFVVLLKSYIMNNRV